MARLIVPAWKEAPFIRLLVPFLAGILIEWYAGLSTWYYTCVIPFSFILIVLFSSVKPFLRFRMYWLSGILINLLLSGIAGFITYKKDFRHLNNCITRIQKEGDITVVTLTEPLITKPNSFKSNAAVSHLVHDGTPKATKGNIIIYFQKNISVQQLTYNGRLAFQKKLQPIKNQGNPGDFDYRRYCIFQQIYYQVYLKPGDFVVLPQSGNHLFKGWLFKVRKSIVNTLQRFIHGPQEAGLAEALLIGYKDDLDKTLVQLYSNTGVVHIIAISGLHVGLIYWLLHLLLKPLKKIKRAGLVKAVAIIAGLWIFSFLTGGSASVSRSALMFSFIVMGENTGRKTNMFNSLAASAFILLCYNPYWLWDAGFQLSYLAVLGIMIFMRPVYNWFYIKNKLLDNTWKMATISIAAQVLTTPVSIFHFQQFPNYFLITNLVAVPLSSLIVLAELALCIMSPLPLLSIPFGNFTGWLITMMNDFIIYINKLPFTVTTGLKLSFEELLLVYILIFFTGIWIFQKNKYALIIALGTCCCLCFINSYYNIQARYQQQLVVYNTPRHKAIDLVLGKRCLFIGDSMLANDVSLQNLLLQPSRNEYRIQQSRQLEQAPAIMFMAGNKRILVVDDHIQFSSLTLKADVVIISGKTTTTCTLLQQVDGCKLVIFDSTHSNWEIEKWKAACSKAGIAFYAVAENGAFIFNLN